MQAISGNPRLPRFFWVSQTARGIADYLWAASPSTRTRLWVARKWETPKNNNLKILIGIKRLRFSRQPGCLLLLNWIRWRGSSSKHGSHKGHSQKISILQMIHDLCFWLISDFPTFSHEISVIKPWKTSGFRPASSEPPPKTRKLQRLGGWGYHMGMSQRPWHPRKKTKVAGKIDVYPKECG